MRRARTQNLAERRRRGRGTDGGVDVATTVARLGPEEAQRGGGARIVEEKTVRVGWQRLSAAISVR